MSLLSQKHLQDEEAAYQWVEAHLWPDGPVCPHCGSAHRNIVLALVQRGGEVRTFHVSGTSIAELMPIIRANVSKEAAVMTDGAIWYKYMNKDGVRQPRPG